MRVGEVPCDLRHPGFVRLTRDAGDLHGARLQLHDKEDDVPDQPAQGQYLDGEKVRRRQTVPMSRQEGLPRCLRAALRRGLDAVVLEDRFDRVPGDVVTEVLRARRGCACSPTSGSPAPCGRRARRCPASCSGDRDRRFCEPSYLLATRSRYQRRIVSGVTMPATSARRCRPRVFPFTASRRRWSSVRRTRRGPCAARRIRFSSSRYSMTSCCCRLIQPENSRNRKASGGGSRSIDGSVPKCASNSSRGRVLALRPGSQGRRLQTDGVCGDCQVIRPQPSFRRRGGPSCASQRRPDASCHATLRNPGISATNWQFEIHRFSR